MICASLAAATLSATNAEAKKPKAPRVIKISKKSKERLKKRMSRSVNDLRERAETLDEAMLYHASLFERLQMARAGSANQQDLEKIGSTALVLNRFDPVAAYAINARLSPSGTPASFRVAMAEYYMHTGSLLKSADWLPEPSALSQISDSGARIKAAVVASSIFAAQNERGRALDSLEAIPESRDPIAGGVLQLQHARLQYDEGKLTEALEDLQRVTRQSSSWYPGVMVAAWSAYRVKDYNLALGQLMTLHSPHLAGKFNPESYILKAATLFRLCYFESAAASLQQLRARYSKITTSMDRFKRQYENKFSMVSTVLNYARGETGGDDGSYPEGHFEYLMDGLLSSEPISQVDRSLMQVKHEQKLLDEVSVVGISSQMKAQYLKQLEGARREYYRKGLKAATQKLALMRREASEALESSLAVEVEINTRIRERLISGKSARMRDIDFEAEIKKGYEFWPFQGEYWQDEGGGYAFATSDICGDQGT